jgi:hypothetical protein
MEDYGFEYSDEDGSEQDVDIENQYYNSKGLVPSARSTSLGDPVPCIEHGCVRRKPD